MGSGRTVEGLGGGQGARQPVPAAGVGRADTIGPCNGCMVPGCARNEADGIRAHPSAPHMGLGVLSTGSSCPRAGFRVPLAACTTQCSLRGLGIAPCAQCPPARRASMCAIRASVILLCAAAYPASPASSTTPHDRAPPPSTPKVQPCTPAPHPFARMHPCTWVSIVPPKLVSSSEGS